MPYINVYIHFVWCTKNREPYLESAVIRKMVWEHIKENALKKNIFINCINGYTEHCHCTISLRHDQTMSQTMQLLKGESSYWINKNKLCKTRFEWQDEYFAASVSPSALARLRQYIFKQEEHHKQLPFEEEFDQFVSKFGFERFKDRSIKMSGD